jgi:hypothetical protein
MWRRASYEASAGSRKKFSFDVQQEIFAKKTRCRAYDELRKHCRDIAE